MSSYIKSEFYRIFHNKWTHLFIGVCAALLLSSNIVLAVVNASEAKFPYATTRFAFGNVTTSLAMVYILCIGVANMIFGNENNNHTMKNTVSYGISRGHIYFGKLIVQIAYAIISFVIILGIDVVSASLLLENSGVDAFNQLIRACVAGLPLFIVGLAVTNCFVFILEGSGAIAAASGIMIALPVVANLLGMKFEVFRTISKVLPWNILNHADVNEVTHVVQLYWSTTEGLRNCWIIGITQAVLFAVIGFVVFRKKEIK